MSLKLWNLYSTERMGLRKPAWLRQSTWLVCRHVVHLVSRCAVLTGLGASRESSVFSGACSSCMQYAFNEMLSEFSDAQLKRGEGKRPCV